MFAKVHKKCKVTHCQSLLVAALSEKQASSKREFSEAALTELGPEANADDIGPEFKAQVDKLNFA